MKRSFRIMFWVISKPHVLMVCGLVSLVACSSDTMRNAVSTVTLDSGSPYGGTDDATSVKIGRSYVIRGKRYQPRYEPNYKETGKASWYGPGFHGRKTANGERYDQYEMTAAHRTLPLPSMVRVTRRDTGKSIIVRVNDRGPFAHGRIIDLSKKAAQELDMMRVGVADVKVEYLPRETGDYLDDVGLDIPDFMREDYQAMRYSERYAEPEYQALDIAAPATVASAIRHADGVERVAPTHAYTAQAENLAPANAMDTKFLVHTASFPTYYRARAHAESIARLGRAGVIPVTDVHHREYRVTLGPVGYDTALELLQKTKELGFDDARILVE